MTVIAVDPGPHIGVAIHITDLMCPACHDMIGAWLNAARPCQTCGDTGKAPDEYLMVMVTEPVKLWDIVQHHRPDTIVLENFASSGLISRDGQSTIRLVGAVELMAYITEASLVLQSPQERYPQMDNARSMLKQQLGRKLISHEVDSLAHLLLYEHRVAHGIKIRRRTFETTTI